MRTPLNGLLGMLQLAASEDDTSVPVKVAAWHILEPSSTLR